MTAGATKAEDRPVHTSRELAAMFPDVWGIKWATRPGEFRRNAERLAKQGSIGPGDQVLDIGAGGGFLAPVCRRLSANYQGIDVDFREYAIEVRRANGASVWPFEMKRPGGKTRTPAGLWDVIVCGWIVFGEGWDLPEWRQVILGLFASLTPGGRLVLRFNEDRIGDLPDGLREWLETLAGRRGLFGREKSSVACGFVLTNRWRP